MPIDHGLDLFRVNLQAADIDDAALAPDKEITVAAPLHHIAGIDEALRVEERRAPRAHIARRGARRTNAQRAVDDFHLDAVANAFEVIRRKSGEAVIDGEADAGFGRGVGVADAGLRKSSAQIVEDRLVGDFSGEANVARRDFADLGRHQRAAPMRRRARQMRHAMPREPEKMIGDRLAGARQNERRAAKHRAQENLQSAIAADVVERAPDDGFGVAFAP